jgi:uncharacterized phage protein (TIGR01671 family)
MIKLCRAKEENTGEWVYGYYTLYPKCCGLHPCILSGTESGCIIPKFIDLDTLGSCTDMTDVNDTEMFEGDIIKIKSYDYDYEYITQVYYSCHTLCVDIYGQDYDFTAIGFADDIWDEDCCEIEVIGNIYDNPELVGDEENDSNDT